MKPDRMQWRDETVTPFKSRLSWSANRPLLRALSALARDRKKSVGFHSFRFNLILNFKFTIYLSRECW